MLAGFGLARDYINNPKLTDKYFIQHTKYGRLYKTGDLGFLTKEYGICIKGRSDRQIKKGGFRIELDDVRSALEKSFKGFNITCAATGETNNKRLIAYIEIKSLLQVNYMLIENIEGDIIFKKPYELLCELLPSYMLPDFFMALEEFPLNKNNKIDYLRLPDVKQLLSQTKTNQLATLEQKKMANLWAVALDLSVEQITTDSNFFKLGGDSLQAVNLINKVDKEFSISCDLKMLFDAPILASFTNAVVSLMSDYIDMWPDFKIDKENRFKSFALTPVQQAYWIGRKNQFDLGGVGSHSYYEFDIVNLDLIRFQCALDLTIIRHDMLRMVIDDNGQQRILQDLKSYPLEIVDMVNKTKKQRDEILISSRDKLSHEVIDMKADPTFKVKIFKFKTKCRLILSYDALQFDAWSFLVFIRNLSDNYEVPNFKPKLLSVQFRDYIKYLENLSTTKKYKKAKLYWTNRIESLPYGPELPIKSAPTAIEFNRISASLEHSKWTVIVNKAKQLSCTPTCLMLAVFALVIKSYSSKSKFCLNLTLFNRLDVHTELEEVIGDFTSLILFEIKENNSILNFAEYLRNLQQQLFSDLDNRIYDGILVQRDIRRANKQCPNIIAPVVFTSTLGFDTNNFLEKQSKFEVKLNYSITQTPQVWLDNQIKEDDKGVHWVWDYLNGLFSSSLINEMHKTFENILHELVDEDWQQYMPETLLCSVKQQLIRYNETKKVLPKFSLTTAIDKSFATTNKDTISIIDSNGSMNYQDLYENALKLAEVIQRKNYPSNSPIGIFLNKGHHQVVGCLAILFAGHYFVPFNLANPKSRLSLLIKESAIVGLISNTFLANQYNLPESILIDVNKRASKKLTKVASPNLNDVAYVIYTSGSTGVPKGVVITHLAVMNTLIDINRIFNISSNDRVLALSDLSFDLSIYDVFGILLAGGCIIFPDAEHLKEPAHWFSLIIKHNITIWNSVPMLFSMLLHAGKTLPSLKTVLLSGDWIMPEIITKGYNLCVNAKLIALGGATECSIWSNHYILDKDITYDYIPYGFPLRNQSLYILHKDLSFCPVGVAGELYIGGIGLAREYFADEKKNHRVIY